MENVDGWFKGMEFETLSESVWNEFLVQERRLARVVMRWIGVEGRAKDVVQM